MNSQYKLRKTMRARRRHLSESLRLSFSEQVARVLVNSAIFKSSQHIALYMSNDGEVSTHPIIEKLWKMNKKCYIPVIYTQYKKKLMFALYTKACGLTKNRYGIYEPVFSRQRLISPNKLDLIIAPLVAFDSQGNRLGMGGGYYDRTFEFLKGRNTWKKPRLMGIAYEFQRVRLLTSNSWDIPLEAVVTEIRHYSAQHKKQL